MPMFYFDYDLAKIYYRERLEEAAYYRRLNELRAGEPSLQDRLLSKLGDLLICCGTKLKKHTMLPVSSGKF
jgi:hypothetical protein